MNLKKSIRDINLTYIKTSSKLKELLQKNPLLIESILGNTDVFYPVQYPVKKKIDEFINSIPKEQIKDWEKYIKNILKNKKAEFHLLETKTLFVDDISKVTKKADLQSKLPLLIQKYLKTNPKMSKEKAEQKILSLNQYDPTNSYGVYTPWIVKLDIEKTSTFPEDGEKIKEALTFFNKIKNKPINIPKDIFQYNSYSDLAKTLEPYKDKSLSKREEEKNLITQGQEIIYDDGTYQVIKITTPEASHNFCYSHGATHWCTKDIGYAKEYLSKGPLYVFMKNGNPIAQLHKETETFNDFYDKEISKELYLELLPILKKLNLELTKYKYKYETFSPNQINKEIEKRKNLDFLYKYQKLSPEQIDKAIEKRQDLDDLYHYQKLSPENINKAIEKGKVLNYLYAYQKLSTDQIDEAIEKEVFYGLYRFQKLSPENINKAIEKGEYLNSLYDNQKLSPENINKAIEKGIDLYDLYSYQKLSPENINKAIEKEEDLVDLYNYQKLFPENIDKAIEKGKYLGYLYNHQKLSPENIDKAIEEEKDLADLYDYQKLSPEQKQKINKESNIKQSSNNLKEYKKKRNFNKTLEPLDKKDTIKNIFVIQEHNAKKAGKHWDFRIEEEGVLKSFVIRKMKLPKEKERLLCIPTENHPISYWQFSGKIPEGEYGAGTVKIVDKGKIEKIKGSIKSGNLLFRLEGKKYKGKYKIYKTPIGWFIQEAKQKISKKVNENINVETSIKQSNFPSHPNDIIIDSDYYKLTEKDIWNYYDSIKNKMLPYLKNNDIMLFLKADGIIVKRNRDGTIRINNEDDFNKINNGRTVEFHIVYKRRTDKYVIDLDAHEKFGNFNKVKKYALQIGKLLQKQKEVKKVEYRFSGNRGIYIIGMLKNKISIDRAKENLKNLLEKEFKEDKLVTTGIAKENQMRIDISTFHRGGSIKSPYSLSAKTGLISLPINNLEKFKKEDAKINKLFKKSYISIKDKLKNQIRMNSTLLKDSYTYQNSFQTKKINIKQSSSDEYIDDLLWRGVLKEELFEILQKGILKNSEVPIPEDNEVVEYLESNGWNYEDILNEIPWNWKRYPEGVNLTTFENACGYGDYVIGVDCSNYANFNKYFLARPKDCKIKIIYNVRKDKFLEPEKLRKILFSKTKNLKTKKAAKDSKINIDGWLFPPENTEFHPLGAKGISQSFVDSIFKERKSNLKHSNLQSKLPILISQFKKQFSNLSEEEIKEKINLINQADPTKQYGTYTPWLLKLFLNKTSIFPEDTDKIKESIELFEKIKNKPNIQINKDIMSYNTYGDLAKTLEPYEHNQEIKTETEIVEEGFEIVYEDSIYKVIKINKEEAASKLCRHTKWCIKDPKWFRQYTPPFYLFTKNNNPYILANEESQQIMDVYDKEIPKELYLEIFPILKKLNLEFLKYEYKYETLSPEDIDKAIEKEKNLYYLYIHQKLSLENIDKAIEKGKGLYNLYKRQKLSSENIDKAIEKGKYLDYLYHYQKLSPENIDKAIEKGKDLADLYEYQTLSPENIDKVIEKGKELNFLYKYQKLSPNQIDKAIEKREYLYNLYTYQKLSLENMDKAIEKREDLNYLYRYQKLSPEQIDKAIEKGEYLADLYYNQKLSPEREQKINPIKISRKKRKRFPLFFQPLNINYFKLKEINKKSSIIDYPYTFLPKDLWRKEKGKYKLKSEIKEDIIDTINLILDKYFIAKDKWFKKLLFIGSTSTQFFLPETDIDAKIVIDKNRFFKYENIKEDKDNWKKPILEKLRNIEYKINKRPLDLYIISLDELKGYIEKKSDSIYDILENKWIKEPQKIDISKYDRNKIVNRAKEEALEWAKKWDLSLGEIKRDIKDYELIEKHLSILTQKEKKDFKEEINKILIDLEKEIEKLSKEKKDLIKERHKSFDTKFTLNIEKFYLSINWMPKNIKFKLLNLWGYLNIIKSLEKFLDDDKVTENEVEEINQIIKENFLIKKSKLTRKQLLEQYIKRKNFTKEQKQKINLNKILRMKKSFSKLKPIHLMALKRIEDVTELPDKDYIIEYKYDGWLTSVIIEENIELWSRRGNFNYANNFPNITSDLKNLPKNSYFIGELCWIINNKQDESKIASLCSTKNSEEALKKRNNWEGKPILYLFDVLWYKGKDYFKKPWKERRYILEKAIKETNQVKVTKTFNLDNFNKVLKEALNLGGEGVVLKNINADYKIGKTNEIRPTGHMYKIKKKTVDWDVFLGKYKKSIKSDKFIFYGYMMDKNEWKEVLKIDNFSKQDETKYKKMIDNKDYPVITVEAQEITPQGKMRQPRKIRDREDRDWKSVSVNQLKKGNLYIKQNKYKFPIDKKRINEAYDFFIENLDIYKNKNIDKILFDLMYNFDLIDEESEILRNKILINLGG